MSDQSTAAGKLFLQAHQSRPVSLHAELSAEPGQLLALLGPSGSGKTTLLRTIAGLNKTCHGNIRCGADTWLDTGNEIHVPPQRRRVGLVFQDYALFPHMTALQNVATAIGHRPAAERSERARALLQLVHLQGLEDRHPAALSGGQCQRVALARALARDPQVLLLDEPFSAVDQVTRRKLQRELALLRRQINIPILLVTHDLSEATMLADQICVLHRGRTLQQAAPAEVLLRPASPLIARLMDQPNIYTGEVLECASNGSAILAWNRHRLEVATASGYRPGDAVSWMIPGSHVVLHHRDRPSRGERENPLQGVIHELVELGESTSIRLHIDNRPELALHFSISSHVARRNRLNTGVTAKVSLLADGIHLMPAQPGEEL